MRNNLAYFTVYDKTSGQRKTVPVRGVFERVPATSSRTLSRIAKKGQKLEGQFWEPQKSKPKVTRRNEGDFNIHIIHRTVNPFQITQERHLSLSSFLRENTNFNGQISSLPVLLKKIDTWRSKCQNKSNESELGFFFYKQIMLAFSHSLERVWRF